MELKEHGRVYFENKNVGGEFKCDIFDTLLRTFVNAKMQPHAAQ
jgi:hypothetical protein